MNHNKTILIDGVRYHKDRPASCRQCYFWKNRKAGCTLEAMQDTIIKLLEQWQKKRQRDQER